MSAWTTLRDDLLPWRWHKDDNREAWIRRALEAAAVFTGGQALAGSGMFAAPAAAGETAATAAAASQPVASAGMFNMVPGVTTGSEQAAMLAAQNAGMGGTAADLTAQAAMDAVRASNPGMLDSLMNTAKLDLAGMNDPSVWGDRLARNASRFAGTAGRGLAMQALMGGQRQPTAAPPPPRPPQQPMPAPDMFAGTQGGPAAGGKDDLMREFEALPPEEKRRLLELLGGRA